MTRRAVSAGLLLLLLLAGAALALALSEAPNALRRQFDGLRDGAASFGLALAAPNGWRTPVTLPVALEAGAIRLDAPGMFAVAGSAARLDRSFLGIAGPPILSVGSVAVALRRDPDDRAARRIDAGPFRLRWSRSALVVAADEVRTAGTAATAPRRVRLHVACDGTGFAAALAVTDEPTGHAVANGRLRVQSGPSGAALLRVELDSADEPAPFELRATVDPAVGGSSVRIGTVTIAPGWRPALDRLRDALLLTDGQARAIGGMLDFLSDPTGTVRLPLRLDRTAFSVGPFSLAAFPPARDGSPLSACRPTIG